MARLELEKGEEISKVIAMQEIYMYCSGRAVWFYFSLVKLRGSFVNFFQVRTP